MQPRDGAAEPADGGESAPDETLVERARGGDRRAFGALVARHQQAIGGYLLRLTGDRETAHDLAQETFVRAFHAVGATRPGLLFRPWLFRIATNLARDHFRRQRRFRWFPLGVVDREMSADDGAAAAEERDLVRRALAGLRQDERAVLLLCGLEGLDYAQAAAALGGTAEAVRKRFARAKARFAQAYGRLNAAAGPAGGAP